MPDAFDQLNDTPQRSTAPASATPTTVPSSTRRDIFDDTPTQASTVVAQNGAGRRPDIFDQPSSGDAFDQLDAHEKAQTGAAQAAAAKEQVARHGILRRAWDWVNQPILDNILPKDIKTADVIKAAAFEKLYNEAYIPGVNDFETKAQEHLGENPTKHGIRTFINGVASDTSNMAAGVTSPVGIATTALGVGPEGKAVSALRPLVGTAFALKGAHDVYHAGTANTPEAWQERLQGAAMVAGGVAGASEAAGKIADTTGRATNAAKNFATGGQAKLQPAIRGAAQTAADLGAARPSIELATAEQHPVRVEFDDNNNVINSDGGHRVVQAWKDGGKDSCRGQNSDRGRNQGIFSGCVSRSCRSR